MLNDRLKAAQQVSSALTPTEDAIDDSLHRLSLLLATMHTSRVSAHLPRHTGQAEFSKVTKAIALIGEARDHILSAHVDLAATRDQVLPNYMWGAAAACPAAAELAHAPASALRAVG